MATANDTPDLTQLYNEWTQPSIHLQDHFQDLLEAAAASEYGQHQQNLPRRTEIGNASTKRKRQDHDDENSSVGVAGKRQKRSDLYDRRSTSQYDALAANVGRDGAGSSQHKPQAATANTGEADVTSGSDKVYAAMTLFKAPTLASEKYTRPPMAKIFDTLLLSPEEFLDIQAAAKSYMLDERYPERSEAVGVRTRGDSDLTKLRLFACVKEFLEDEGWGERCWGAKSVGIGNKKLKWPRMKNQIITAVSPLLRRILTNERQRLYATEARKNKRLYPNSGTDSVHPNSARTTPGPESDNQRSESPRSVTAIDPKLKDVPCNVEALHKAHLPKESAVSPIRRLAALSPAIAPKELRYLVRVVQEQRRVKSQLCLTPSRCPGFPSLLQNVQILLGLRLKAKSIKVLGPNGLLEVDNEGSWKVIVKEIEENEWMDGEVRIVVEPQEI